MYALVFTVDQHPPSDGDCAKLVDHGYFFGHEQGQPVVEVDLQAPSLARAIVAAVWQLTDCGAPPTGVQLQPLMTVANLAALAKVPEQEMWRWTADPAFPLPAGGDMDEELYQWPQVATEFLYGVVPDIGEAEETVQAAHMLLSSYRVDWDTLGQLIRQDGA